MKYVKLKAKNFNEALMQLREKYGEDAIPISHKNFKEGGLMNTSFLAKEVVELTAAIHEPERETRRPLKKRSFDLKADNDLSDILAGNAAASYQGRGRTNQEESYHREASCGAEPARQQQAPYQSRGAAQQTKTNTDGYTVQQGPAQGAEAASQQAAQAAGYQQGSSEQAHNGPAVEITPERYDELKKFEKEFYEIKESLKQLADAQKIEQENREAVVSAPVAEKNEHLRACIEILKNNDYTDEECSSVISEVKQSMTQSDLADMYKIEKNLREVIKSNIVTTGPVTSDGHKKVLMFVGPTGVGKTTSLAKLGAHLSLRENKRVVFVTIDTYRIAATEQLKKYAEIMHIPIHVVSDPKQFSSVIEKEQADVVLVDTSGRSHRNTMKIAEIKNYADKIQYSTEKFLCVSAGTKRNDLATIFHSFEPLEYTSVLITKVDETSFVGNVLKVADSYNKPISYISDGQEVPNNLRAANPDILTDYVVSGTVECSME